MNTMKKLKLEIGIIILLLAGLCISSLALAFAEVEVSYTFTTGSFDISVRGDGENGEIISQKDRPIAPGEPITKNFTVTNNGDYDVYYRIHFSSVSGAYEDVLRVTIKDGEKVLYDDLMKSLDKGNVKPVDTVLKSKEEKILTITFTLPTETEQVPQEPSAQGPVVAISFALNVDAVQSENNTSKDFGDAASAS